MKKSQRGKNERVRSCRQVKKHSSDYFAVAVNGTFPWQLSVFSVLWTIMFQNWLLITMSKRTCFIFQAIFPHFFPCIGWPEGPEIDIVTCSDSVSLLIWLVFRWYKLMFFSYCICLFSSLRRSKSVTTCFSIFCPLTSSVWNLCHKSFSSSEPQWRSSWQKLTLFFSFINLC